MFTVYLITNIKNGKAYVGHTCNLRRRWYQHIWHLKAGKHHSLHLQNAFDRYGEDNFKLSVLLVVNSLEYALEFEQLCLDGWKLSDPDLGYNSNPKSSSTFGSRRSEQFKSRQRDIFLGREVTWGDKISKTLTGKKQSQETIKKRVKKTRGLKRSPETIKRLKKSLTTTDPVTAFGKTQSLKDWSEETGIPYSCLYKRIKRGWSPEETLSETKSVRGKRRDLQRQKNER